MFAFVCSSCDTDLTGFLSEDTPDSLDFVIGGPMVKPGRFVRVKKALSRMELFQNILFAEPEGSEVIVQAGDYLLHISDLRHQMHSRVTFGCCGYQAGVEANVLCPRGHPIGTIHSDCCYPSVARLMADSVECVAL